MQYTSASIKTFLQQIHSGRTKSDAAKIARLMQSERTLDTNQISNLTGIKESTVSARIDTLREMGIMRPISERKIKTGYVTIWGFVSDPAQQVIVSREYRREKFVRRLKGLLDEKYIEFCTPYLRAFVTREVQSIAS